MWQKCHITLWAGMKPAAQLSMQVFDFYGLLLANIFGGMHIASIVLKRSISTRAEMGKDPAKDGPMASRRGKLLTDGRRRME
ncbi:MAG: hypothetical protein PVJ69_00900 [Desulfobacteraceae bacterium]|jgi:hypothetical protein